MRLLVCCPSVIANGLSFGNWRRIHRRGAEFAEKDNGVCQLGLLKSLVWLAA